MLQDVEPRERPRSSSASLIRVMPGCTDSMSIAARAVPLMPGAGERDVRRQCRSGRPGHRGVPSGYRIDELTTPDSASTPRLSPSKHFATRRSCPTTRHTGCSSSADHRLERRMTFLPQQFQQTPGRAALPEAPEAGQPRSVTHVMYLPTRVSPKDSQLLPTCWFKQRDFRGSASFPAGSSAKRLSVLQDRFLNRLESTHKGWAGRVCDRKKPPSIEVWKSDRPPQRVGFHSWTLVSTRAVYTRLYLAALPSACPGGDSVAANFGNVGFAAERSGLAGPVGPAKDRASAGLGDNDRRSRHRDRADRYGREPDAGSRRCARPRVGLRRERRDSAGHIDARDTGRKRDRRPREQPARNGGALLGVPGHAGARDRWRCSEAGSDRSGDRLGGRARRAHRQREPHACREPGPYRAASRAVRTRPRGARGRAAGNAGNQVPQYPAAYPGVLSVGGTDDADSLYFWSSRGPWVALTAPGCHMVLDPTITPGTICGMSSRRARCPAWPG